MNAAAESILAPFVAERARERFASLGVTLGVLHPDGSLAIDPSCRGVESLIAGAPPFKVALSAMEETVRQSTGQATAIWPGVWLAPLPVERRRRGQAGDGEPVPVAMLLGVELLSCEQLHLVCASLQLDYRGVLAQIDRDTLVTEREAQRLAKLLAWVRHDAMEIERRHLELRSMSQQLAESYEELSLLYKLSSNMAVNQPPQQLLTDACQELREVIGLTWLSLLLVEDEPRLNHLRGQLYVAGSTRIDHRRMSDVGRSLIARQRLNHRSMIFEDAGKSDIAGLGELASNVLAVPLVSDDRLVGVIFGGDKIDGSHISSIDSKLCSSLANSLAIFLQNLMLYEDMQAMFMGTLHALTSSIDAKDSYTHGHSERVALMSRELARAAKMDDHLCERVYIAGLVHDVGKIGVPEAVLCKPGPLTDEEFGLIKLHPVIGARILRDIRQMSDLIPGVLYHHERWDGRGYPHGLRGEGIPLMGRLIGLADAFDAMSSNRTYRRSMKLEQVRDEIRRCAGRQFDPRLAEIFVDLDFTPFFELIQKHQAQQSADAAATDELRVAPAATTTTATEVNS